MPVSLKTIVSVIIIAFLASLFIYQLAKPYFKLHPWTRNTLLHKVAPLLHKVAPLLEGLETMPSVSETGEQSSLESSAGESAAEPTDDPTQKSTQLAELFEQVNTQMDVLRTLKLSDTYLPLSLDKTAQEPYVILANLKLLINNGVYKNELDIKDLNDKYVGNKGVQMLASDINSLNLEPGSKLANIPATETTFLTRVQKIVDAHQTLIDKILESKSKE
jgi:hypothetical protein